MQEPREHRNRTQIVSASGRRATLRDNSRLLTSMFTLRLRMIFYFRWNYKRKWNIYTMYWRKGIFNIVRRVKSKIYTTLHSVQELVKNQIIHEGIIEFYRSYTESISKFFAKRTIGLVKKRKQIQKRRDGKMLRASWKKWSLREHRTQPFVRVQRMPGVFALHHGIGVRKIRRFPFGGTFAKSILNMEKTSDKVSWRVAGNTSHQT